MVFILYKLYFLSLYPKPTFHTKLCYFRFSKHLILDDLVTLWREPSIVSHTRNLLCISPIRAHTHTHREHTPGAVKVQFLLEGLISVVLSRLEESAVHSLPHLHLSIHPSFYPSIYLSIVLSFYLSSILSIYLYSYLSIVRFWKCWDVFYIWIKWKLKDFQITWANILFIIEHREHNKCLNGEILHFYPLNELISNLMPATGLKKVGTGAIKCWKSKKCWKDSAGRTSSN